MRLSSSGIRVLLLLGLIFVPFTSLRFGPIGVGEVIIIVSLGAVLFLNNWRLNPIAELRPLLYFWLVFPFWLFVGMGYNVFFLGHLSGTGIQSVFDFVAYLFVLMLVVLLADRRLYEGTSPAIFFENIFFSWALVFSMLYGISLFTPSIFGFSLRYYDAFVPLVNNVHQASMVTSAMPFIMMFLVFKTEHIKLKFVYLLAAVLFVFMALESNSTKAWLAMLVGASVGIAFPLVHRSRGRKRVLTNSASYIFSVAILVMFATLYWPYLLRVGVDFFQEADPMQAREIIYADAFRHGLNSLLVGYGPGPQVLYSGRFWDAHNTILSVFLQGGVVGIILFFHLFYKIISRASASHFLMASVVAIGIYAIGGDILRRLPIWIVVAGVLVFSSRHFSNTTLSRSH